MDGRRLDWDEGEGIPGSSDCQYATPDPRISPHLMRTDHVFHASISGDIYEKKECVVILEFLWILLVGNRNTCWNDGDNPNVVIEKLLFELFSLVWFFTSRDELLQNKTV